MSLQKYALGCMSFLILMFSVSFASVFGDSPVEAESKTGIGGAKVPYCENDECGFQQGIDQVGELSGFQRRDENGNIVAAESFSQLIQRIVSYILSFVSLIAVLYIIFAGFQILTGNGEEEKLKKSKQTILYVILGIIVIWLAWPITVFVIGALNSSPV